MELNRRSALVTGGAVRIGAAICRALAADGYSLAVHCRASRHAAEALTEELRAAGVSAAVVQADLEDAAAASGLIAKAREAVGPLALLVNNASLFENDAAESFGTELWDRHFAVNLRAPCILARDFAAQAAGADPSVVNVLDQRVLKLTPQFFSYTLTKSALWTATRTLAQSLAPRIRVNGVGPGPTLANIHDGAAGFAKEASAVPLGRGGTPEEIADAVVWLARARSVTGQMIAVDGGQHLGWRTPDVIV
jgi:NAD(P)-dependent dehydrogenase (short-subunit alcohol dehydrogenase family)